MLTRNKLRWGILGCARISRRGLIPGIRGSTSSVIQAIASRDGTMSNAWAKEFGIPRSYGSYEDLLLDPEVDAVYIPLPNELHQPWTIAAANAGKHVLCEKPLALNAREAESMVEHCRSCQVTLMEAFMWRHQPRVHELLKRLAAGEIGDLRLVRSSFSFPIEAGDWRLDLKRGGGALWDVGSYGVNTARLFTGAEPSKLSAFAHFGPTGVDLSLTTIMEFPHNILAIVDCSFEQPFRQTYEVVGTKGSFDVPNAYLPMEPVSALLRDNAGNVTELPHFEATNQYANMVDAFALSLDAQSPSLAENGFQQMFLLDKILLSAQTKAAVELG